MKFDQIFSNLTIITLTIGAWALGNATTSALADDEKPEIGVLMGSHGDIDDPRTELESYIKTAFEKNVGIPFPYWVRPVMSQPAYLLSVNTVRRQYERIGATHYRSKAQLQVDAITRAMQELGLNGKAYAGFNFTHPFIEETLAQMQKDGIKKLIVYNQGAQFSFASSGENIGDVRDYLEKHPEWDVEAIGFHQYSEDLRFREIWAQVIEDDLKRIFPNESHQDVCLLVGSHGLPLVMTAAGDPAVPAMKRAVAWLRTRLPDYRIYHGFLNDDFIPGATWASPRTSVVAVQMRDEGCQNVLMDARLSFTNHHRATLYDLNVEAREIIEKPDLGPDGQPHFHWVKPTVVLAAQFDGNEHYAGLIAELTKEAFEGTGDFEMIKLAGGPLLDRPDYPVKSNYVR